MLSTDEPPLVVRDLSKLQREGDKIRTESRKMVINVESRRCEAKRLESNNIASPVKNSLEFNYRREKKHE